MKQPTRKSKEDVHDLPLKVKAERALGKFGGHDTDFTVWGITRAELS